MSRSQTVNNDFYHDLGDGWFEDDGHAIAVLRAEGRLKTAYTREVLRRLGVAPGARVLDIACGGGLVSIPLAEVGYRVHGTDLAQDALDAGQARIPSGADLTFSVASAEALPDADASADAVLLLDILEHVESVPAVLVEAARVLRPGGVMLFNTFNRTPVANVIAVHGMKLITRDSPDHLHVARYFVPPESLRASARYVGLRVDEMRGMRPRFDGALARSVARRRVDAHFQFTFTRSLALGYIGYAVRV